MRLIIALRHRVQALRRHFHGYKYCPWHHKQLGYAHTSPNINRGISTLVFSITLVQYVSHNAHVDISVGLLPISSSRLFYRQRWIRILPFPGALVYSPTLPTNGRG